MVSSNSCMKDKLYLPGGRSVIEVEIEDLRNTFHFERLCKFGILAFQTGYQLTLQLMFVGKWTAGCTMKQKTYTQLRPSDNYVKSLCFSTPNFCVAHAREVKAEWFAHTIIFKPRHLILVVHCKVPQFLFGGGGIGVQHHFNILPI